MMLDNFDSLLLPYIQTIQWICVKSIRLFIVSGVLKQSNKVLCSTNRHHCVQTHNTGEKCVLLEFFFFFSSYSSKPIVISSLFEQRALADTMCSLHKNEFKKKIYINKKSTSHFFCGLIHSRDNNTHTHIHDFSTRFMAQ